ncbi:MAG: bifunctional phosphopantothenoylcysteine decarboxylase/phosphopantothenate--cysteine ligase CoaBC [Gammaproteobacteria bacterium]
MNSRKLKIIITAGPTREKIDPVRFITNESSGKMGYEIAKAAAQEAEVVLISGPTHLPSPLHVKKIDVISAEEMLSAVMQEVNDADIFIGVAAVADFSPVEVKAEKIKKDPNSTTMILELKKNPDILATVSHLEKRPFTVGFAAETQDLIKNAKEKLSRKKLDLICANLVSDTKGFNKDTNEIFILSKDGTQIALPETDKTTLAKEIMQTILKKYQIHSVSEPSKQPALLRSNLFTPSIKKQLLIATMGLTATLVVKRKLFS